MNPWWTTVCVVAGAAVWVVLAVLVGWLYCGCVRVGDRQVPCDTDGGGTCGDADADEVARRAQEIVDAARVRFWQEGRM